MRAWPFLVVACFIGACGGNADMSSGIVPVPDGATFGDDTASAPTVDPFADAPAFTAGTAPRASVVNKHLAEGVGSPTGKDCLASNCHGAFGEGPSMVFGGTIYTDPTATVPAVGVQVRVVDANSKVYSVYSDTNGNFYQLGTANLALPAHPGVRTADNALAMVGDSTGASCNAAGCHDGPTQAKVYAP